MAKLEVVGACLFTLAMCCNAHICLLSPPQRGPPMLDLNKAASEICFQTKGPCGSESTSQSIITVRPGDFQVVFQKNLDHYNTSLTSHGDFRISLLTKDKIITLDIIPDKGEPSLHLYTAVVKLPRIKARAQTGETVQLQVVYFTKNPSAPAAFYQCADIQISG